MDICLSPGNANGDSDIANRTRRSDLGKPGPLLRLSHREQLSLPLVVGLLIDFIFFASGLYAEATVPTQQYSHSP